MFARDIAGRPFDPWQRWLAIHGLELLPDGRPRFRQVLVLVARQNGKTEFLVILTLFWLYLLGVGLVLGTSTKLDYARESWEKAIKLALAVPDLKAEIPERGGIRRTNGEQQLQLLDGNRYKIAASNEEGGRSLTIDRLVEDELRQHHDWSAHEAAENAMNAVPDAQAWAISNAGDARSVVLNALQEQALKFIDTGQGDYRLGLFEWSAVPGADITDPQAQAQANPNLGHRIDPEALAGKAQRAKDAGGEQEAKFRTEVLCQRVQDLSPKPVSLESWAREVRPDRPAGPPVFFVGIAKAMRTAAIAVAAFDGDRPHVELADHRPGTSWLVQRLVELQERYPEATIAAGARGPIQELLPELERAGVAVELWTTHETTAACAHLEKLAATPGAFSHADEPLLTESLAGAEIRELDQGMWSWDWKRSRGDVSLIAAAASALWLLELKQGAEYDLSESFG